MTKTMIAGMLAATLLAGAQPVLAQHEGHAAGAQSPGVTSEQVRTCVQGQQQAMALLDAVDERLELARQTNAAASMRAAMDDIQAALSATRSQLAPCAQLENAPPLAGPHAGQSAPGAANAQPPVAEPAGTSGMPCCAPQPPAAAGDAHAAHAAPWTPAAGGATADAREHAAPDAAAGQAAPAQPRQAPSTGDLSITFRTVPSPPRGAAENEFEVIVRDRQGRPMDGAEVVVALYMAAMPAMKMPEMRNEVKLKGAGKGRYTGTGQVMMAGSWTVTVSVRQGGKEVGQQKVTVTAK